MRKFRLYAFGMMAVFAAQTSFGGTRGSDAKIAATIQDRIYHARVFERGQIQVAFRDGVATLTGTVDSLGVKLDAERAARKVGGVFRIVNDVNVHADDVTDRQILEQARKQVVTYYAYGIFDNVLLGAQGDKLVVSGQVSQPFKRQDMGNFLSHIKGVAELENRLEVLPTSIDDERLRLAIARAIFRDPYFVHYANQAVPPIHIIVKNGNVTLEGMVNSAVDRAKAENAARFAATFFSLTNNLGVERG